MSFEMFVEGIPVPQGSKSLSRTGVMYEANKALKPWRLKVAAAALWAVGPDVRFMEGPLALAVAFGMPRPKTVKREHPSVKPDLDKLVRAISDSLTGIVYKDDAQIVCLDVIEIYGLIYGARIFVHPATEVDILTHWLQRNKERANS
ncbi:MAG: RusA family crossover junction endodeoxyribonuclease [Actinomycetales bacterium]|nr:RusA family crossover junction endodeoxyribonuclease [Actinomycetales bacterium]